MLLFLHSAVGCLVNGPSETCCCALSRHIQLFHLASYLPVSPLQIDHEGLVFAFICTQAAITAVVMALV